jgi:hypothetical protein
VPTAGIGSAQTKKPLLPTSLGLGGTCIQSNSAMKFSYCFVVRR